VQQLSGASREGNHQHSDVQRRADKLSHLVTEQRALAAGAERIPCDKANPEAVKQTLFRSHTPSPGENAAMIKVITRA